MGLYFAFDKSVARDDSKVWNKEKEAQSIASGNAFRDYFNKLAEDTGVADRIAYCLPMVGFAPPVLQMDTDDATAEKLAQASKGRVFMSKPQLH